MEVNGLTMVRLFERREGLVFGGWDDFWVEKS